MEILYSTHVSIPLFQVTLLLTLSTLSLIFGRVRLALLVNYCFTLYWGFFVNLELFMEKGTMSLNSFTFTYFAFGIVIILLAIIGFMSSRD